MEVLGHIIVVIFVLFGTLGWILAGFDLFAWLTGKLIRPKPPLLVDYIPPFQDMNPLSRHRMGQ